MDKNFDFLALVKHDSSQQTKNNYANYLNHYLKSIKYMKRAETLLQDELDNKFTIAHDLIKNNLGASSYDVKSNKIEDTYLLAFRMYTRAIISS